MRGFLKISLIKSEQTREGVLFYFVFILLIEIKPTPKGFIIVLVIESEVTPKIFLIGRKLILDFGSPLPTAQLKKPLKNYRNSKKFRRQKKIATEIKNPL